jgi:two-component system, response regulator
VTGKKILLVEDNPDDEMLTLRALRKHKIANKVSVVRDGVEALDFVFCRGTYADCDPNDMPELILLDLRLPKLDGLEVLRVLRLDKRTSRLPVIILTSSSDDEDSVNSYKFGANAFIRKPVDFRQLVEAVRELDMSWTVLNEIPEL